VVATAVNLFALRPRRAARFERGADGLVTVRVPKFTNRFAVRWLVPLMARPDVTVRLDAEGSFVWDRCDGGTTVHAIAEQLHQRLGGDETAVGERVGRFVEKLARASLVTMDTPGEQR
jgi:Coenzyme PQQ synthesis protein D (PqqD)